MISDYQFAKENCNQNCYQIAIELDVKKSNWVSITVKN